ncbi:WD40 repeat-like protein [Rhizopogon salebrosus TDB-379]|nr:WD40 repeat-like protein [Rhizopogon salebrosus TDB-379]
MVESLQEDHSLRPRSTTTPTTMTEVAQTIIRITTPRRVFKDNKSSNSIITVAVFPDGHRMVTGSLDKMLCLWNLKDGVVLKKMEGHRSRVEAVALSRDGKSIASGDLGGELIGWDGDTGDSLTQPIKVHSEKITSLDFSPDGAVLATVSWDKTIEMWSTKTWHVHGNPIDSGEKIFCVRYAPSGELLAIATANDIQVWNPHKTSRECVAKFRAVDISAWHISLAWTPDGTRIFSGGSRSDSVIREWDTSTWQQIGDTWRDHTDYISALAVNSTGTLVASASLDTHVRLWRLSDRRTIAIFKASDHMYSVTFSMDGKHILCGGRGTSITELAVPEDALLEDTPREQISDDPLSKEDEQAPSKACSTFDSWGAI